MLWTHSRENVAVFGEVLEGFSEEVMFEPVISGWRGVFQTKQISYAKTLEIIWSIQKIKPRSA